ncbi:MAG TPA: C25 family cysteine peptidase [Bacteroidales bacterium]|nr:C25 family cysteine peptidase [Bacteroidales bacterium]
MKKSYHLILTVLTLSILSVSMLFAAQGGQEIRYQDPLNKAGFELLKSDAQGVTVSFSLHGFSITEIDIHGTRMQNIEVPGIFLPNDAGAPNVPGSGRMIALPRGATARLEIVSMRTETMQNILLAPAPRIPLENEDGLIYPINQEIYNTNAMYPAQVALLSDQSRIRGVDAVTLGISPFQYNPVTKELRIIRDITVRVIFEGGESLFGEDRLRSRWWDPIFRDVFLNSVELPAIDYTSRITGNETGYEYLIICPDNPAYLNWADTIKNWRTTQGIKTGIVTISTIGGNTTSLIESYINNAYNTWSIPPAAVLLMADYGTGTGNAIMSPTYNNYCISDHIYADVSGNHQADIAFARMTAQSESQLAIMVEKMLSYERQPSINPNFYNNPITAMGWQTERWFQLCSEIINGFFQYGLGKSPVRENAIYSGTPGGNWSTATNTTTVVNYFGPSGLGYIPATSSHLTDWGGNATRVNNDINNGAFILQHRDHGSETGWGEPDYGTNNLSGLNNNDLPFVFSVNCLTGKFNYASETFAEAFHRYPKRALGIIAATEVSYSFVNDAYVWGLYDNMWPDFMPAYGNPGPAKLMPAFGNVAGKLFLEQSSWPYNTNNKQVTYYLFHHHGDAFTTLFSEIPSLLTVVHDPILLAGANQFQVSADSGSLICLSANGNILATTTGTGSPIALPIAALLPGDILMVTVTKQNHYRYSQPVMVIPPAGPYVIKDVYTISDANGNGQADYGEEVYLNLQLKNVGIQLASAVQVTLSTNSPYIQMLDDTEVYGDIMADSVVLKPNAFRFRVAENIPDLSPVVFNIIAQDTGQAWNSQFSLILHAPVLKVKTISVLDPGGNENGIPDPGETVTIQIQSKNEGTAAAGTSLIHLVSTSPYITIQGANSQTFSAINANALVTGSFTVQIDTATPNSYVLDFISRIACGPYNEDRAFLFPIGEVHEDFETGNLSKFNWVNSGNGNWYVTNVNPNQGTYCARSGSIGNNASTSLSVTLEVLANDTISFFRKVSSEANYDYLKFYIDNVQMGQWAGTVPWGRVSYPVSAGTHTFKWTYMKDTYMTGGSDAAWIDDITFPPVLSQGSNLDIRAVALSPDICEGESTPLYAVVTGGGAQPLISWSPVTSLNDPTVYNPVASPNNSTLYQAVVSAPGGTDTAWVNVQVNPLPEIMLGSSDTTLCAGNTLVLDATVSQGLTYLWEPGGVTTPVIQIDTNGIGIGDVTFQVEAINVFGCKDQASIHITFLDCTGLEELSRESGITFYPNPITNGQLHLMLKDIRGKTSLRLYNELGVLVKTWQLDNQTEAELSLHGLPAGLYILQASGNWGQQSGKLVLK